MKWFFVAVASALLFELASSSVIPGALVSNLEEDVLNTSSNNDTLIFAHVITRHGEVIHRQPGMPMTNVGKRQLYETGQYLRKRYIDLVGGKYSSSNIYIVSTDNDRAIMSAQACLAGFFPPTSEEEKWNDDLLWQPIPVHTIPDEMDTFLHGGRPCPKYNELYDYYMEKSPEALETMAKYKNEIAYWEKMSHRDLETIEDVTNLYKRLMSEDESLPDWAKEAIKPNGPMELITRVTYKLRGTPELVRRRSGFLIKDILERTSKKINKKLRPDRSMWIYSAHSSTLATMLNGLQIFELNIPPFGSTLHFELYKTPEDKHYVQFVYRRFGEENPVPSNIPGCGEKWTLDQFYSALGDIIPGSFESECEL